MAAHDHELVLQRGIRAPDQRDDAAVGDHLSLDGGRDLELHARERNRLRAGRGVGRLSEIHQRASCVRRREELLGKRRRDLRRGNRDLREPGAEHVGGKPSGLLRGAPESAQLSAARLLRMVVHVADEEDGRRAGRFGRHRLEHLVRRLRGDDAVEEAVRIRFAGFVIEREDDLPLHVPFVVVVAALG